ncbi:MAG: hypothetical protein MRECE_14c006 [Mycoplasmataceae bacterium CE_OT135]|nr:MAG: hypothetical protein MRECE_14c006 [Mycoplasmataceae bacterium CE_OT135]
MIICSDSRCCFANSNGYNYCLFGGEKKQKRVKYKGNKKYEIYNPKKKLIRIYSRN